MNFVDFTKPGGLPFFQDTLKYLQDGYRAAFGALAEALHNHPNYDSAKAYLLSGTLSSGGWVYVDGHVMPFVGANPANPQVRVMRVQDIDVSTSLNPAVYEDGNTYSPYRLQRGAVTNVPVNAQTGDPLLGANDYEIADESWSELMEQRRALNWVVFNDYQNDWGGDSDSPFEYAVDSVRRQVFLRGRIVNANTSALSRVGQFPVDLLPADLRFVTPYRYSGTASNVDLRLLTTVTNGNILLGDDVSILNNQPATIELDGISWFY